MKIPFNLLLAGLMFSGLAAGAATTAADQCGAPVARPADPDAAREVRYRKNIDDLTPEELAAFKHAVDVMKKKSIANVYDRTGFIWQAWVHNCTSVDVLNGRQASLEDQAGLDKVLTHPDRNSCDVSTFLHLDDPISDSNSHKEYPGECEHSKDTFLQWHRAQLYFYEQALRAADPDGKTGPKTDKVTLPYWNFTRKPSGVRYPKAFEDKDSPLFDKTRIADPLPSSMPTASPYLLAYQIYFMNWQEFGGDAVGSNNGGALETRIHNLMHARYMGGNMGDNVTAGLDPLFYAFHNFLDYSFEKWLDEHGDAGITGDGRSDYLRSEQDASLAQPLGWNAGNATVRDNPPPYYANMGQAGIYFDTVKQGFGFQPHYGGEFIRRDEIQAIIDRHAQAGFVFGDNQKSLFAALLSDAAYGGAIAQPQLKRTWSFPIPKKPVERPRKALLQFDRYQQSRDYSFQADVYLYPAGVKEDIANKQFRDRYLVTNTSHWALTGHHTSGKVAVSIDVTGIVNSLVQDKRKKRGKAWKLTLAVSPSEKVSKPIQQSDFSDPVIVVEPKP